jgi:hypothetical protein
VRNYREVGNKKQLEKQELEKRGKRERGSKREPSKIVKGAGEQ